MEISWKSRGNLVEISWKSRGNLVEISWKSRGNLVENLEEIWVKCIRTIDLKFVQYQEYALVTHEASHVCLLKLFLNCYTSMHTL